MTVTKTEIVFFFSFHTLLDKILTPSPGRLKRRSRKECFTKLLVEKKKKQPKKPKNFLLFPLCISVGCIYSSWEHYSLLELPLLELVSMMTQKTWRNWNRGSKFSEIQCNSPSQVCAWTHWLAHLAGLGAMCKCGYLEVLLRQAEWIKKLDVFSLLSFFCCQTRFFHSG